MMLDFDVRGQQVIHFFTEVLLWIMDWNKKWWFKVKTS